MYLCEYYQSLPMRPLILFLFLSKCLLGQLTFVTEDLDRFWQAYDSLQTTTDTVAQLDYLQRLYLAPATPGLDELREARNYQPEEYLAAIRNYPKFWRSIRARTQDGSLYGEIAEQVAALQQLYPPLRPATVYVAMGVFRTAGTAMGDHILFGAEMALPDRTADVSELPEHTQQYYANYDLPAYLPFLGVHEYVHTQQRELVHNLLTYCIYEGVAEFIAVQATGRPSFTPAVAYAAEHPHEVRDLFVQEMYDPSQTYGWLWGSATRFGHRDMGYAVGYQLAQGYYAQATDKAAAIKTMIELDFADTAAVADYVDRSGYFTQPLDTLSARYERLRPFVTHTAGVTNGSRDVTPGTRTMTFHFSEALNGYHTGLDYGPAGEAVVPVIDPAQAWGSDSTSWTIRMDLEPSRHYQFVVSENFRLASGVRLRPLRVEFWTGKATGTGE